MLMMLALLGGFGKNPLRMMLIMLTLFGGLWANPLRLMLMMLALFAGFAENPSAADAHDAGLVFGGFGKNTLCG